MPAKYTSWTVGDRSFNEEQDLFPDQIMRRIIAACDKNGWLHPGERWTAEVGKPMGPGASIGKGWLQIVIDLDEELAALAPDYVITQIKEKFGGLSYYVDLGFDQGRYFDAVTKKHVVRDPVAYARFEACHAAIGRAYEKSMVTCEVCGEPGELLKGSWLKVRCEEHTETM